MASVLDQIMAREGDLDPDLVGIHQGRRPAAQPELLQEEHNL